MNDIMKKMRDEKATSFVEHYGETLYHYTTIPALYGILKNREIWFGNAATMNDKTEVNHFISTLKAAVKKAVVVEKQKECDAFFRKAEAYARRNSYYVFSLSLSREDASQWERYSNNATGVCIAFDARALFELMYYGMIPKSACFYDNVIENHEHYKMLIEYFNNGQMGHGFSDENGWISNIVVTGLAYKNPSFRSENEFRFSMLPNFSDGMMHESSELVNGRIRTVGKVNIVAMCEKQEVDYYSLFKEIIIGPRSFQSKKDLAFFCKELKYQNLSKHITTSVCPLR